MIYVNSKHKWGGGVIHICASAHLTGLVVFFRQAAMELRDPAEFQDWQSKIANSVKHKQDSHNVFELCIYLLAWSSANVKLKTAKD